ncbi:MAG TPA: DUF2891 domain-containing protein [Flavobacterium sp.]|nr:DUF2891 domain-containing protein [Flavobacterium sp.]
MKQILCYVVIGAFLVTSCKEKTKEEPIASKQHQTELKLQLAEAQKIIALPLHCLEVEYPNKLGQVLNNDAELKAPKQLRPIFYGCFDWHSSAHGYWSVVKLLKQFPELDQDGKIDQLLTHVFTTKNVAIEKAFFEQPHNQNFERTYGWAWFFKLQEELYTWKENPKAQEWYQHLKPLEDLFVARYVAYLPKLNYPIRTGTHDNTAFGMALSLEYAETVGNKTLKDAILKKATELYLNDTNCPIAYEPSGHDFLSPCLQEAWLMSKVLETAEYKSWLQQFLPQLFDTTFDLEIGKVSDRTDGHLVHLDGLNFSRATCLFQIVKKLPELNHLKPVAEKHFNAAFPNISNDDYMGSHWLGSFALQALDAQ